MTKFMRYKEEHADAAGPVDVFVAETRDEGVITVQIWPRPDGTYVVTQGHNGVMGAPRKHKGPRMAYADFAERIAEQIRYRSSPGQKFTSGDVQELAGVNRQALELRRKRGSIKGGTKTGRGFIYTAKELADILSSPTLRKTRPPGDLRAVRKAYGNLYLRSILTPKQRQVVEFRYPEPPDRPLSLDKTAELMGLSRQRVSQHEHAALDKLLNRQQDS